ncbi:hypothetical protein [Crocosphaera chwakensis]|uniref:Uncharacterized protein n=1 Tax=Crocosphaera chwakensis CCY0110 TaxID=391612 RepID=A3ILQ2_9CHRO|nr:hypothetical protein [Crocosphaera chwakensis]EAZ92703.1 hypothetical protein CY0110_24091 [Crocosphaera chwakensis CCY0110]
MVNKKTINSLNYSENQTIVDQSSKIDNIPESVQNKDINLTICQNKSENVHLSKLATINFKLAMTECFILLQKVAKK